MEVSSQAPITSEEASQAFGQLLKIETEADLINALDMLAGFSKKLLGQVNEMGDILQANAINDAKKRALEISNKHPFSPYHKVAVAIPTADGSLRCEIQDEPTSI